MKFTYTLDFLPIRVLEIYFEEIIWKDIEGRRVQVVRLVQCSSPDNTHEKNFMSPVIDLTNDISLILAGFKKQVRYDINKASRYDTDFSVVLAESELLNVIGKLDNFLQVKGLKLSNKKKLKSMFRLDKLVVTEKKDLLTNSTNFHFYLVCDVSKRTRLLYSFSHESKGLNYDLNKAHLFHDVKFFKSNGYRLFDLGGISSVDAPNGIDKFKLGFQGEIYKEYTGWRGVGWFGKLMVWVYYVLVAAKRKMR